MFISNLKLKLYEKCYGSRLLGGCVTENAEYACKFKT